MGPSISLKRTSVDDVIGNWRKEEAKILNALRTRMTHAVQLVYSVARARRSYVYLTGSYKKDYDTGKVTSSIRRLMTKKQIKNNSAARKVSDPRSKYGVPVASGALRAGIEKEIERRSHSIRGRIWSKEQYGQWIEFGTSKMQARPFMRPAFNLNKRTIRKEFAAEIK